MEVKERLDEAAIRNADYLAQHRDDLDRGALLRIFLDEATKSSSHAVDTEVFGTNHKDAPEFELVSSLLNHFGMSVEVLNNGRHMHVGDGNWLGEVHDRLRVMAPGPLWRLHGDHDISSFDLAVMASVASVPTDDEGDVLKSHRQRGRLPVAMSVLEKLFITPLSHTVSLAVPNEAALQTIAACGPIIECGAGTGYWSALLQQRGVDVLACELQEPMQSFNKGYARNVFTEVFLADGSTIFEGSHARPAACARTLLLVWPNNPDSTDNSHLMLGSGQVNAGCTEWDAQCLEAYTAAGGQTVCFVGEREERVAACLAAGAVSECGSSASRTFQKLLSEKYELVSRVIIPTWPWNVDDLTVWRRSDTPLEGVYGPCLPEGTVFRGPADHARAAGSDVAGMVFAPFVPTSLQHVDDIISLASITEDDVFCDLGFGDAALLCAVLERTGCSGIGCEIDGDIFSVARQRVRSSRLESRLELTEGMILPFMESSDFRRATVCFVFLVPQMLEQMLPALQSFLTGQGVRIVAERFEIVGLHCTDRTSQVQLAVAAGNDAEYFPTRGPSFLYGSTYASHDRK